MQPLHLARYRSSLLDTVQLCGIASISLALVPTGAHVLAMPARLALGPQEYLAIQGVHDGLATFAVLGFLALAIVGAHTLLVRRKPISCGWSLVAAVALGAAQILVWSVAYPVSVETAGWTVQPADFEAARARWEYGFALAGGLSFAALLAFVRAVEASRPIASMAILTSIERDAVVRAARMRARPLDGGDEQPPSSARAIAGPTRAA